MTPEEKYDQRKQWFLERVGKRVFRSKTSCPCSVCVDVYKNGLIIMDTMHANYLCDVECDIIRYFDTKEEVIEFEKTLCKKD